MSKSINIKDRNYELYSVVKNNEVFTMELTKKDLIAALSEKQTIINKAIEYIKTVPVDFSYRDRPEYIEYSITEYNYKLLNILEGVDKE